MNVRASRALASAAGERPPPPTAPRGLRPPTASLSGVMMTPRTRAESPAAPPSASHVGALVGAGAKEAQMRLAKAQAEEAVRAAERARDLQSRAHEKQLEQQAKAHAVVLGQLRHTRVLLLHRSLSAALCQAALKWAVAAKATALARWGAVPAPTPTYEGPPRRRRPAPAPATPRGGAAAAKARQQHLTSSQRDQLLRQPTLQLVAASAPPPPPAASEPPSSPPPPPPPPLPPPVPSCVHPAYIHAKRRGEPGSVLHIHGGALPPTIRRETPGGAARHAVRPRTPAAGEPAVPGRYTGPAPSNIAWASGEAAVEMAREAAAKGSAAEAEVREAAEGDATADALAAAMAEVERAWAAQAEPPPPSCAKLQAEEALARERRRDESFARLASPRLATSGRSSLASTGRGEGMAGGGDGRSSLASAIPSPRVTAQPQASPRVPPPPSGASPGRRVTFTPVGAPATPSRSASAAAAAEDELRAAQHCAALSASVRRLQSPSRRVVSARAAAAHHGAAVSFAADAACAAAVADGVLRNPRFMPASSQAFCPAPVGWTSPSRLANPYKAEPSRSPSRTTPLSPSNANANLIAPAPPPPAQSPALPPPAPTHEHPFGLRTREGTLSARSPLGAHTLGADDSDDRAGKAVGADAEPRSLADALSAGLAALEAGADFDFVERALREEEVAAAAAEAAMAAAAARWQS